MFPNDNVSEYADVQQTIVEMWEGLAKNCGVDVIRNFSHIRVFNRLSLSNEPVFRWQRILAKFMCVLLTHSLARSVILNGWDSNAEIPQIIHITIYILNDISSYHHHHRSSLSLFLSIHRLTKAPTSFVNLYWRFVISKYPMGWRFWANLRCFSQSPTTFLVN